MRFLLLILVLVPICIRWALAAIDNWQSMWAAVEVFAAAGVLQQIGLSLVDVLGAGILVALWLILTVV